MDSWLIWNLTGEHVTDVTNASRTMLMNLESLDWDDKIIAAMDVPRRMLPKIRPSSEIYGEADGVLEGVLVAGALGDQQAALWEEVKDKLKQSGLGLSGGQQQRLCIARGIAVKPEVLLLDEPASALDPVSTAKLEETVVELKSEYTIVIVTHNLQQATRVSDNTGFMFLGRLIEFAPTAELFSTPRAKRTADYIGGRFG